MKATKLEIRNRLSELYSTQDVQGFEKIIFESVLGYSRVDVMMNSDKILDTEQRKQIGAIVNRLTTFEPIQYILGEAEFYGRSFEVAPGVLIPRPETEELIEWILENNKLEQPLILDIGTGSGCIPITLAQELPEAKVQSFDISPEALAIAQRNNNTYQNKVELQQVNILEWEKEVTNKQYDIIVSNPPYVTNKEKEEIQSNVLDHEPHLALFVEDNDPLLFYRRIGEFAQEHLKKDGFLFFEINQYYGPETVELLKEQGFSEIELRKDISSNNRMIRCKK